MKSKVLLMLGGLIGLSVGMALAAEEATTPKPGVVETGAATVTATVESIDYPTRMVTLKGPEGNMVTLEAGPEITRFNELKKGDLVTFDYLEAVAVMVQTPDANVSSAEGSKSVIIRNKTKRPSGMQVTTDVITATVEKIDAKKRVAVLKGPQGNTLTVNVAPDVQHLENVKKGDQVVVQVTRSVAIKVSQAPSKK